MAGVLALIAVALFSGVRHGPQDLADSAATLSQNQPNPSRAPAHEASKNDFRAAPAARNDSVRSSSLSPWFPGASKNEKARPGNGLTTIL